MLYQGGCGSPVWWMRLVRSMLRGESIFCGRRNTSSNYTEFSLLFCGIANSSSPWCSFYHCLEIFRSNLYPFSIVFGCVKTSRFVTIASQIKKLSETTNTSCKSIGSPHGHVYVLNSQVSPSAVHGLPRLGLQAFVLQEEMQIQPDPPLRLRDNFNSVHFTLSFRLQQSFFIIIKTGILYNVKRLALPCTNHTV